MCVHACACVCVCVCVLVCVCVCVCAFIHILCTFYWLDDTVVISLILHEIDY